MPLTLNSTSGDANANSYASLSDALAYATEGVSASAAAWLALTDDESKKRRLITATRLLDTLDFASERLTAVQRLEFPRIQWPILPRQIVEATVELAFSYPAMASENPLNPVVNDKRRVQAGDVEVEYFDRAESISTVASRLPLFVLALIEDFLAIEAVSGWGSASVIRTS